MAYSDYKSLLEIERTFGIKNKRSILFDELPAVEESQALSDNLKTAQKLSIRSEKARSEFIVVPILLELRKRNNDYFTIYSGDNLNADEARGLKGECDFILAKDTGSYEIEAPLFQIVEAKKNDVELGIPQCAAQLLGAKLYNEQAGIILPKIYGCVTTGNDWLFLCLEKDLTIDIHTYYLGDVKKLLAVFQVIINYYQSNVKL